MLFVSDTLGEKNPVFQLLSGISVQPWQTGPCMSLRHVEIDDESV